ncbi:hypothetical protein [Marinobacter sediminicola]|nr:hypothetical protein [Marinobacter sp. F26243]
MSGLIWAGDLADSTYKKVFRRRMIAPGVAAAFVLAEVHPMRRGNGWKGTQFPGLLSVAFLDVYVLYGFLSNGPLFAIFKELSQPLRAPSSTQ